MRPLLLCAVVLTTSPAWAGSAPADRDRVAVVAFGDCTEPGLAEATRALRQHVAAHLGSRALSEEATAAPGGGLPGASLAEVRRALEAGKDDFLSLKTTRSESVLRGLLAEIDRLPLGPQRWDAFCETRAWLARVLQYAKEKGKATELFLQILRVDEEHELSRIEFPPSSRELLEMTRSLLPGLPRFKLTVTSKSGEGQVYLNGYAVGPVPFERQLLHGDYEAVVADGAARSFSRRITLSADTHLSVDLEREAPFAPDAGPCFRSGEDREARLHAAALLAGALGAEQVVAVRRERLGEEDYIAAALLEVGTGREVREGRVRRDTGQLPSLARLAQFVLTGEGSPELEAKPVPRESLAVDEPDDGAPARGPGRSTWQRPVAYALWGAALALGGAAVYQQVRANDQQHEMDGLLLGDGSFASRDDRERYHELQGSSSTARRWRTGLAVGAGVAAATGGAFLIWSVLPSPSGPQASWAVAGNFEAGGRGAISRGPGKWRNRRTRRAARAVRGGFMRWLLATLVVAVHAVALGAPRLAIQPLRSHGASPEALQQLHAAIRLELAKVEELEIPEATPAAPDCKGDSGCLVAWGHSLGAAEVLWGEVRALPDSYSVTLHLIDVPTAREIARTAGSYNRDVEEMVWAARAQIVQLKCAQRYAGRLLVDASDSANARVNGTAVRPGVPIVLTPGRHEVGVSDGERSAQAWVEVRFEQTATVRLSSAPARLETTWAPWSTPQTVVFADIAAPRAPRKEPLAAASLDSPPNSEVRGGWPRWPGLAAMGAGAVLAGVGVYELVQARALRRDLEALRGTDGGVPADEVDLARKTKGDLDSARLASGLLTGIGGALVAGGAAYLVFAPAPGGALISVGGTF